MPLQFQIPKEFQGKYFGDPVRRDGIIQFTPEGIKRTTRQALRQQGITGYQIWEIRPEEVEFFETKGARGQLKEGTGAFGSLYPTREAEIGTSAALAQYGAGGAHIPPGLEAEGLLRYYTPMERETPEETFAMRFRRERGRLPSRAEMIMAGERVPTAEETAREQAVFEPGVPVAPTTDISTPPTGKKFQESDVYKALSAEEKEIADLLFNVISVGGEAEAKIFADAIQQSIAIAEPWAKAQAAMALAEFAGAVDETIFGFTAKTEAIQRARDILAEDVSTEREFLTLEQQSEVARQVRQYDQDLLSIADQAAERGLTFATGARSRALAETRRTEQFQDVIQSSRRRINFQIKELELKAARGDVEAQKQLETIVGEQGFTLRKIGRSAEEILGSERARQLGIAGFAPVGGVTGKLEEEKEKRIISDIRGIVGLTDLLTT